MVIYAISNTNNNDNNNRSVSKDWPWLGGQADGLYPANRVLLSPKLFQCLLEVPSNLAVEPSRPKSEPVTLKGVYQVQKWEQ